jgi:hypothetical protein
VVTLGAAPFRDIVAQCRGQPDVVSQIRTLNSPVDIAWAVALSNGQGLNQLRRCWQPTVKVSVLPSISSTRTPPSLTRLV